MILPFLCAHALALDGDTLRCEASAPAAGYSVRLARIDAPELPGHCIGSGRRAHKLGSRRACAPGDPFAAREALQRLVDAGPVRCTPVAADPRRPRGGPRDRWHRLVARCRAGGRDLGATLLAGGFAERWP